MQEEAEKEAKRRGKEEAELKKQLKKQQEEAEKEQKKHEKEEAELKKQILLKKQANMMERFLSKSKNSSKEMELSENGLLKEDRDEFTHKADVVIGAVTLSMDSAFSKGEDLSADKIWRLVLFSYMHFQ
jgi:chromatin assembly factor 1 subunit A